MHFEVVKRGLRKVGYGLVDLWLVAGQFCAAVAMAPDIGIRRNEMLAGRIHRTNHRRN